jgi:hypothetical protein
LTRFFETLRNDPQRGAFRLCFVRSSIRLHSFICSVILSIRPLSSRNVSGLSYIVFLCLLSRRQRTAFYGFKHVQYANSHRAIECLLITDELVRIIVYSVRLFIVSCTIAHHSYSLFGRLLGWICLITIALLTLFCKKTHKHTQTHTNTHTHTHTHTVSCCERRKATSIRGVYERRKKTFSNQKSLLSVVDVVTI